MAKQVLSTEISANATEFATAMQTAANALASMRKSLRELEQAATGAGKTLDETGERAKSAVPKLKETDRASVALDTSFGNLLKKGGALMAGFATLSTVFEGATKVLRSTQSLSDGLDESIAKLNATTDHFFRTIATADWSNLISGWERATEAAREYTRAKDEAGNHAFAYNYWRAKAETEISRIKTEIKDPNLPKEKRDAMMSEAIKLTEEMERRGRKASEKAIDAAFLGFQASVSMGANYTVPGMNTPRSLREKANSLNIPKVSREDIVRYMEVDVTGDDSAQKAWEERYQRLKIRAEDVSVATVPASGGATFSSMFATDDALKAQEEIVEFVGKNIESYKRMMINQLATDDKIQAFVREYQEGKAMESNSIRLAGELQKARNIASNKDKQTHREALRSAGSIARAEQDLKRFQTQFSEAVDDSTRSALSDKIKELERTIAILRDPATYRQTAGAQQAIELPARLIPQVRNEELKRISATIKSLESILDLQIKADVSPESIARTRRKLDELYSDRQRASTGVSGITDDIRERGRGLQAELRMPKGLQAQLGRMSMEGASGLELYNTALDGVKRKHNEVLEGVGMMSNAFGSLGKAVGGTAGAMLQWGASVVDAVAQALPQIAALTTAQQAEQAAASASAVAKSASSASVLGPIATISAIASVVAALMAVPKFERGGIVGGASYYGDKILARVNSGEMIANTTQQRRIYEQMTAGRADALNVVVNIREVVRGQDMHRLVSRAQRMNGRR